MQRAVCPTQTALYASIEEQEDGGKTNRSLLQLDNSHLKLFVAIAQWDIRPGCQTDPLQNANLVLITARDDARKRVVSRSG